jgi:hypothetical protein
MRSRGGSQPGGLYKVVLALRALEEMRILFM